MQIKITLLLLCCFQISFSQNIKGNVSSNHLPIANVEVINVSSKDMVTTNSDGNFEIKASIGNWITFYHQNYDVIKIYVDSSFNFNKDLKIKFAEKTTAIEEVVIEKKEPFLKGLKTGMPVTSNGKPNVYFNDGSIPNGMNFIEIGKMIVGLFKNKDKAKPKEIIEFRAFTDKTYDANFLANSLKLSLEEIEPFLEFCNFDPKASEAVTNSDKLVLLEFLIVKSEEYKKLHHKE